MGRFIYMCPKLLRSSADWNHHLSAPSQSFVMTKTIMQARCGHDVKCGAVITQNRCLPYPSLTKKPSRSGMTLSTFVTKLCMSCQTSTVPLFLDQTLNVDLNAFPSNSIRSRQSLHIVMKIWFLVVRRLSFCLYRVQSLPS